MPITKGIVRGNPTKLAGISIKKNTIGNKRENGINKKK